MTFFQYIGLAPWEAGLILQGLGVVMAVLIYAALLRLVSAVQNVVSVDEFDYDDIFELDDDFNFRDQGR